MAWISELDALRGVLAGESFQTANELLCRYERVLAQLARRYSLFELALNVEYGDADHVGNLFQAMGVACRECGGDFLMLWAACKYPYSLVVFAFRSFFERASGNEQYESSRMSLRPWCGNNKTRTFESALWSAWKTIYPEERDSLNTNQVPLDVFCARCWLIKNFQRGETSHSQLCKTIRILRRCGDKELRTHAQADMYADVGNYFRRLLTRPDCRKEREFLWDFIDNGAVDKARFHWFTLLDENGQKLIRPLISATVANGRGYFKIDQQPIFPDVSDEAVDRVLVEITRRGQGGVVRLPFDLTQRGWCFAGDVRNLTQRIDEVTAIRRVEIVRQERRRVADVDLLGAEIGDCCRETGDGVFLLNLDGRSGIYRPGARRLPAGHYRIFPFSSRKDENGNLTVAYCSGAVSVTVNGCVCNGRNFEVTETMNSVSVKVGEAAPYLFGVAVVDPLRQDDVREGFIRGTDNCRRIFVAEETWKSLPVEEWRYECNGDVLENWWNDRMLYRPGKLTYCYLGREYRDVPVTFVDFSVENVRSQFPAFLGVRESRQVRVGSCGAVSGNYDIGAADAFVSIRLSNDVGELRLPIAREGIVFRAADGTIVLSIPFADDGETVVEREIAREDFCELTCTVTCAPGYEQAQITQMTYVNGRVEQVSIPLLKDPRGFSFKTARQYLAGRSGRDGDLAVADLVSGDQVSQVLICTKPCTGTEDRPRVCRLKIYNPKMFSPKISVEGQSLSLEMWAAHVSRDSDKEMLWLASDALDSDQGVQRFASWTSGSHDYNQDATGRWKLNLRATLLQQDLCAVFDRGAVILAFIAEKVDGEVAQSRLMSGGFGIMGPERKPITCQADDWVELLRLGMHERYGRNTCRLGELLDVLTLNRFDRAHCTWDELKDYQAGISRKILQIGSNIRQFGVGADLYMNAFYNRLPNQWCGYLFFAGFFYATRMVQEMREGDARGFKPSRFEDCPCLISSTGVKVWHPLLIPSKTLKRAVGCEREWCQWFRGLKERVDGQTVEDLVVRCLTFALQDQYRSYLDDVKGYLRFFGWLDDDLVVVIQNLIDRVDKWREARQLIDAGTENERQEAAVQLFQEAQIIRDALIMLDRVDARLMAQAIAETEPRPLFIGEIVKGFVAKRFSENPLHTAWYTSHARN